MSEPRKQHTTPQFILRNFLDDEGLLYYFRKSTDDPKIVRTKPKRVFVERDTYSVKGPNQELDLKQFSRLEGLAAPVINSVLGAVRSNRAPNLSTDDQSVLKDFIYFQWTRVSEVMDPIVDQAPFEHFIEIMKQQLLSMGGILSSEDEQELLENRDELMQRAKVIALREPSLRVMPLLERRKLTIDHISIPACFFVIGSSPVVKSIHQGGSDLNAPEIEVSLAVAPDTSLVLRSQSTQEVHRVKDREAVQTHNETCFEQSRGIASNSRSLLVSLANRFNYRVR